VELYKSGFDYFGYGRDLKVSVDGVVETFVKTNQGASRMWRRTLDWNLWMRKATMV
jgi:hypothetical protein